MISLGEPLVVHNFCSYTGLIFLVSNQKNHGLTSMIKVETRITFEIISCFCIGNLFKRIYPKGFKLEIDEIMAVE